MITPIQCKQNGRVWYDIVGVGVFSDGLGFLTTLPTLQNAPSGILLDVGYAKNLIKQSPFLQLALMGDKKFSQQMMEDFIYGRDDECYGTTLLAQTKSSRMQHKV